MTTGPIDDEALLARFRDWLQAARLEARAVDGSPSSPPDDPGPGAEVGLYRLVEEFTALRQEVKLETKGSRGLTEQVESLLPALRQAIDHFRAVAPREEQAVQAVARPMAEAMADLDESLDRGRLEIEKARDRLAASAASIRLDVEAELEAAFAGLPWYRRRLHSAYHGKVRGLVIPRMAGAQPEIFAALLEGYGFIQARLRAAMQAGQVSRIDCIGRPVDPTRMSVVEAVETADQPSGHVVDEVRRGYTWRGRVLRYAEVRAARERAGPVEDVETESEEPFEDEIEVGEAPGPGAD